MGMRRSATAADVLPRSVRRVTTRGDRRWTTLVATGMATLVGLLLWTLFVVEPTQTVSEDVDRLYAALDTSGWLSFAILIVLWLCAVVAVTGAAVVVGSARRASSPGRLFLRRVTAAAGAFGLVATVSAIVPGTQVRLSWYLLAEGLGIAPPTGSISSLLLGILFIGSGLLVLAVVGLVALGVTSKRWT